MFFDMPGNRTLDKIGTKCVFVRTTGHEKMHFTVVLCCMANGSKLPPLVIFNRKPIPKMKNCCSALSSKWVDGRAGNLVLAVKDMGQKVRSTIEKNRC